MDSFDTCKKAKARGATVAAPEYPAPVPATSTATPTLSTPAGALTPAGDARFATWRPGSGPPPPVPPSPPNARSHAAALEPALLPEPAAGAGRSARSAAAAPTALAGPGASPAMHPETPLDDFFYRDGEDAPALGAAPVPTASEPVDGADEREGTEREEYLTFLLGQEEYAVAIERVREVLKSPPITEVPRAPPHVLGVVTVRGEVVAVVDPRRRLGLPEPARRGGLARLIIVDAGDGPCALLVDCVANVVRLRPGSIEPRPQGLGGAAAECLAGIGRDRDRLFTVLELGALLKRAPAPRRGGDGRANAGA
jgi:purine-binding chemotaxis protein CheW